MKRRRRNKKRWGAWRYAEYYERIMEHIWTERWETDLKRLKILKKNILALGPIPQKETQMIKTVNHFVKFLDLLTSFVDIGTLRCAPVSKADSANALNEMLVAFVAREESTLCYLNKTEVGKTVTTNSLYLGLFLEITDDDIKDDIQTKVHNGTVYKVEVDFSPLSDWLNRRVITTNGHLATISQKTLANLIQEMQAIIFETIDEILN